MPVLLRRADAEGPHARRRTVVGNDDAVTRSPRPRSFSLQRRFTIALVLLMLALVSASAIRAAETIPPKPAGYFNDYAGVVSQEAALRFNEQLAQFERETSNQIIVAVWSKFPSASSLDDFAQRTYQVWQPGQKGKNNGAILFVFVEDHKMR